MTVLSPVELVCLLMENLFVLIVDLGGNMKIFNIFKLEREPNCLWEWIQMFVVCTIVHAIFWLLFLGCCYISGMGQ